MLPHPDEGRWSARLGVSLIGPAEFILRTLLEQYERSKSFAAAGTWRRDCILRIDKNSLPDYFAADGRERLAALQLAASTLQRKGQYGWSMWKCSGSDVSMRSAWARANSRWHTELLNRFHFYLATALNQTTSHIEMLLQTRAAAPWMQTYLASISQRLPVGTFVRWACSVSALSGTYPMCWMR